MMKSLLLVDCHNILYRSFYAIKELSSSRLNLPTNALYGFIQSVFRIVERTNPTHLIFCLDSKEKTLRTETLETYKANRPVMPDKMIIQMKELHEEVLPALQIQHYALSGYEADDIMATLSAEFIGELEQILLLSSDRDLWQLLDEKKIKIISPAQNKEHIEEFSSKELWEKAGIRPDQVVDFKAITGDPSDNIQGIPGVGPKTAQKWLSQGESLEKMWSSDPVLYPKITEYKPLLQRNQQLIRLDTHVPINKKELSAYAFRGWNWSSIEPMLDHYQFTSLIKKYKPGLKQEKHHAIATLTQEREAGLPLSEESPLFCWLEGTKLHLQRNQTSQIIDLITISDHSLFSTPNWLIALKEDLQNKEQKPVFFDFKTIAHALQFTTEEIIHFHFDDMMLMWYLLEPNRKQYLFSDWLAEMTDTDKSDTQNLTLAAEKTKQQLHQSNLVSVYETLEIPLVVCLFDMESRGVHISPVQLAKTASKFFQEQQQLEKKIHQQAGQDFNIQSPKQLGFILYEKLGLPSFKKTKTGFSTDASSLEKLANNHPIIPTILHFREVSKMVNTYLEPMQKWIDENQLVHTCYIQAGPSTGRIASMNPNLQALPNQTDTGWAIRSLFQVRKINHRFISADYSQIDLRVLAHLSKDPVLTDIFLQHGDVHDTTARKIFHLRPDQEPTPAMRKCAKVVQFGILYGMSPFGLSQALSISDEEARQYIHSYFSVYQGVKAYIDQTIAEAKQKTYVKTISGRKRAIPEFVSSRKNVQQLGERLAVNTTVQGSSADILKKAMIDLYAGLHDTTSFMVLTIHDEIIVESPEAESEQVIGLIREKMEHAWSLSVPLVVHITTGTNLGELS